MPGFFAIDKILERHHTTNERLGLSPDPIGWLRLELGVHIVGMQNHQLIADKYIVKFKGDAKTDAVSAAVSSITADADYTYSHSFTTTLNILSVG